MACRAACVHHAAAVQRAGTFHELSTSFAVVERQDTDTYKYHAVKRTSLQLVLMLFPSAPVWEDLLARPGVHLKYLQQAKHQRDGSLPPIVSERGEVNARFSHLTRAEAPRARHPCTAATMWRM